MERAPISLAHQPCDACLPHVAPGFAEIEEDARRTVNIVTRDELFANQP
jgi:hypothetical protein